MEETAGQKTCVFVVFFPQGVPLFFFWGLFIDLYDIRIGLYRRWSYNIQQRADQGLYNKHIWL